MIPAVDDSDWWIAVEAGVDGKADLTKPAGAGEENQRSSDAATWGGDTGEEQSESRSDGMISSVSAVEQHPVYT